MSMWDRIKNVFKPQNVVDGGYGTSIYEQFTGGSAAGVSVNEHTVRNSSAVTACLNLIGGAIAGMPKHIYQRTADGRQRTDNDLWWLLNEQPNATMSAFTFWSYLLDSKILHGDGFARIVRASEYSPKIVGFDPIHPGDVVVKLVDGRLTYTIRRDGDSITKDQDDMIHVPGAGFNGLRGMSQIKHSLRNAVGVSLAANEYSAAFFKNSARPDFGIEVAGNPTLEQQEMIRRTFLDRHSGPMNSGLPMLLVGGAKIHPISMNAEDSQLIQTRMFQIEDIARVMGVNPFMIGHTEKTSSWGTGVEQISIGFNKYTLSQHIKPIENEFNRKCFKTSRNFIEFLTAGLERGDIAARTNSYRVGLGRAGEPGWLTQNEVRGWENLPAVDGGDTLMMGIDNAKPTV